MSLVMALTIEGAGAEEAPAVANDTNLPLTQLLLLIFTHLSLHPCLLTSLDKNAAS